MIGNDIWIYEDSCMKMNVDIWRFANLYEEERGHAKMFEDIRRYMSRIRSMFTHKKYEDVQNSENKVEMKRITRNDDQK